LLRPDDKNTRLKSLKWYKNLASIKGRLEAEAFLIEGKRAISQIISSDASAIIELLTTEKLTGVYKKYPTRFVNDSQLYSISSTQSPQGIIAVVNLPQDTYTDNLPSDIGEKILLLEDIQDPGNIGTLIRTAAAFDFSGIILTENCADPFSPKVVQSAAGTVLSVWIRRTSNYLDLVKALKRKKYSLIAADLSGAEDSSVLQREDKLLLAFGNEASGLSDSVLNVFDYKLRIPVRSEKAESLNVAVSGAICMYLTNPKV